MARYTKEFLIAAFISRFNGCALISAEKITALEKMADNFYDEVGRDKFRVYTSLDAEAIRAYKKLT